MKVTGGGGLPWSFEYATYLVVIPGVRNYFQLNLPTKRRQIARETKLSSHSYPEWESNQYSERLRGSH